tara:strand:- start:13 stop:501 length:489 start_codon:yes stop_codon:yes gene_type:complete
MTKSFLSLGSNIESRYDYITKAVNLLSASNDIVVQSKSKVYESPAMYNTNLDDFLNIVLKISTSLNAKQLLDFNQNIESRLDRVKEKNIYESRTIDIDILTFGDHLYKSKNLTIPHPMIKERMFVLKPWSDIDSNYVLPGTNNKICDLLMDVKKNTEIRLYR